MMPTPGKARALFMSLVLVAVPLSFAGCGGEAPEPTIGTKEFEEAKEKAQQTRREEYGRPSLDAPAKSKKK